jgi:hypothetical protein
MRRGPSHSTVCLIGSQLEQGSSLIFWIKHMRESYSRLRQTCRPGFTFTFIVRTYFYIDCDNYYFSSGTRTAVLVQTLKLLFHKCKSKFRSRRAFRIILVTIRRGFFSFSITVFVTAHTLIHLRPGPSGVTGFMGSLLDLMRRNWGC